MCGILAVIANKNVNSYYFLKQLEKIQHRGQDACGIAFVDKEDLTIETQSTGDCVLTNEGDALSEETALILEIDSKWELH